MLRQTTRRLRFLLDKQSTKTLNFHAIICHLVGLCGQEEVTLVFDSGQTLVLFPVL